MWKNTVPSGTPTHDLRFWGRHSSGLATASDDFMGITWLVLDCVQNATIRFTANENVALSANTTTAALLHDLPSTLDGSWVEAH